MARPLVHATTEHIYGDLPEVYRDTDAALDYPLLRFLSLTVDQLGAISDVVDRIDYIPVDDPEHIEGDQPGSQLGDPTVADPAWLPWLAQLVGVHHDPRLPLTDQRESIADASSGWNVGTRQAIADAAKSVLTGSRLATVTATGPWQITVSTTPEETPGGSQSVLDAIETARVRPAGTQIVYSSYAASWDLIETRYPTWADIEAAGRWSVIESTV